MIRYIGNQKNALLTQLVECLLDVEKVSGSSPLQRTNNEKSIPYLVCFFIVALYPDPRPLKAGRNFADRQNW